MVSFCQTVSARAIGDAKAYPNNILMIVTGISLCFIDISPLFTVCVLKVSTAYCSSNGSVKYYLFALGYELNNGISSRTEFNFHSFTRFDRRNDIVTVIANAKRAVNGVYKSGFRWSIIIF